MIYFVEYIYRRRNFISPIIIMYDNIHVGSLVRPLTRHWIQVYTVLCTYRCCTYYELE